jgi:2-C-methyl-D-erythritol 4-phosphate cytidylyltransferase
MGILTFFKRKKKIPRPSCAAVIAAAGSSTRMGSNKLFMLLDGIPVIAHTLLAFEQCRIADSIIIVTKSEEVVAMQDIVRDYGISKVTDIISGGAMRTESVMNGVMAAGDADYVMIHDGARPLVTQEVIEEAYRAAVEYGAAAPGIPVKDTIKIVKDGVVVSTPDRSTLYAIQTPQVFYTGLIKGALARAVQEKISYPDDCAAVEAIGMSVHITRGDYRNIKITTEEDFAAADTLLAGRIEG